jgi:hypothetical protein
VVLAVSPVAGELVEVVCQGVAVGPEVRAVGVAGYLDALVGGEVREDPALRGGEGVFEA